MFAVPIKKIPPTFVKEVWREAATVFLQLVCRRFFNRPQQRHATLPEQAVALHQIAVLAGGDDVLPRGPPAARARHDVVEGEISGREVVGAILEPGGREGRENV